MFIKSIVYHRKVKFDLKAVYIGENDLNPIEKL
jgi:hypothetical protein